MLVMITKIKQACFKKNYHLGFKDQKMEFTSQNVYPIL